MQDSNRRNLRASHEDDSRASLLDNEEASRTLAVLFVCHYNVGRSQMAEALFRASMPHIDVYSAGTAVDHEGQTLADYAAASPGHYFTLSLMRAQGLDLSAHRRTQVTEQLASSCSVVISMATEAESPLWLRQHPGYEFWDVSDPQGRSLAATTRAYEEVRRRVFELAHRLQSSSQ